MKMGSSKAVEILPWNLSLRLIELWVVFQFSAPVIHPVRLPSNCVRHLRPNRPDVHFECSPSPQPARHYQRNSNPTVTGTSKLSDWVVSVGLDKP